MSNKQFISIAKDVINLEIKALQNLKRSINNSFNEAVIQISKCQSKVIMCGVGKSGLIASKIASTLASVGTPSFSLSASEASHGDLGMISKNSITLPGHPCKSNRGLDLGFLLFSIIKCRFILSTLVL